MLQIWVLLTVARPACFDIPEKVLACEIGPIRILILSKDAVGLNFAAAC